MPIRPRLHPFEALEWIREAGGTSVIAHPGLYRRRCAGERIIDQGAQGIEVYHSDHDAADEARYLKLAEEHGLIVTGGSDFHGERQGVVFHMARSAAGPWTPRAGAAESGWRGKAVIATSRHSSVRKLGVP